MPETHGQLSRDTMLQLVQTFRDDTRPHRVARAIGVYNGRIGQNIHDAGGA